jgi:putative copper export protein
MENFLHYTHILGLALWLGSMVTWALFAPKLAKIDSSRKTTNSLRPTFSNISWISYSIALLSGIAIIFITDDSWSTWGVEVGLFVLAGLVIFMHSYIPNLSPAIRGMINGTMLFIGMVVVFLATIYI